MPTIKIRAIKEGETEFEVDEQEYRDAKANGTLDHLLDAHLSDIDTETTLIEPDGTEVSPY